MKRMTVSLPDDVASQLREASRRLHRTQAEIVRDALAQYLPSAVPALPRSTGMGCSVDGSVTSENVKDWIRETWRQAADGSEGREPAPLQD